MDSLLFRIRIPMEGLNKILLHCRAKINSLIYKEVKCSKMLKHLDREFSLLEPCSKIPNSKRAFLILAIPILSNRSNKYTKTSTNNLNLISSNKCNRIKAKCRYKIKAKIHK